MCALSRVVGIQGGLLKMKASKKPRNMAANSMMMMKAIRMVMRRHHCTRKRWMVTLKCVRKPGSLRSSCPCLNFLFPSGAPISASELSLSLSDSLAEDSSYSLRRFPSLKFCRNSTKASRAISSPGWFFVSSLAWSMSSRTSCSELSISEISKPTLSERNLVKPSWSRELWSALNLSQCSRTCSWMTSRQSVTSTSRPRVADLIVDGMVQMGRSSSPLSRWCHASKRASGSVFVGILGFSD
mmetsp:Transcript_41027/g.118545  ORF Transcript_41027/g.118545 Transcript_41027/m.118545 type:complete len:241 (+) Transcript_41027:849-1571(+)